ncbi:non-ribosomal peptide synthetase, partial [Massilia phyllosphaerae]|uniref:non-ribosomal peptide synthetase n=1 Tax=Massilia phyllosphaerae TaxID=3106034 RepID=UPI002B1CDBE1
LQPEATAVVYEQDSLTYAELNRRANQVAHRLLSLGVKPDDRVAICVERSLEMVVGLLGILKAGAAYVPLDPAYPHERLAYMLEDSAPVALLTQSALRQTSMTGEAALPVLELDVPALFADQAEHNPDPASLGLHASRLAYIIYTSGSTGQPKGVMVEHRNVLNLILAHIALTKVSSRDRVLQFASMNFDSSVEEIFASMAVGAVLVLRPSHVVTPDRDFIQFALEHRITVLDLPTAFWHEWVQTRESRDLLPDLRLTIVGGEKAELRHLQSWFADRHRHNSQWLNAYGPTETTACASYFCTGYGRFSSTIEIPIGRPIANAQMYILDRRLQPVPLGVAGEIYIGGAGVARGYLNRPDLTAERFIPDPFSPAAGARMYRTGDLGRYLADGNIEYLGRNDFQVKIRGFRIELGEIEARLAACDGVREAIVIAREDQPGDKRLVAYVVPQPGREISTAILRAELATTLADYMLPGAFVSLDTLPLTPNGKLDRNALPAPDQAAIVVRAYEAPQGPTEQAIAEIWQDLLGIEWIGRHDHFFELGGHSLLAAQVVSRVNKAFEIEIPVIALFKNPIFVNFSDYTITVLLSGYEQQELQNIQNDLDFLDENSLKNILEEKI